VRLADGLWVVNVHAHNRPQERALADDERATAAAREWAGSARLVFGGDLNLRTPPAFPGLRHVAGNFVDHIFVSGLEPTGKGTVLERGRLSDHAPVLAHVA
jgi:endonuclease/exonuclease/phosphatase (EEP) superfamily protein YafD